MSEKKFTFYKSKYIWRFLNRQFILTNLNDIYGEATDDTEGDYTFILAESVPTDIYDCIDEETGCLDDTVNGLNLIDLTDVYTDIGIEMPYFKMKYNEIDGGEGGFTIELDSGDDSNVQIQIGDAQDIYLQGIFLVKRTATESGNDNFVLAYATLPKPIIVRNFINIPYNGMVFGVGYCSRNLSNTNIGDTYYYV